jgi:hypothetical protein
MLAGNGQAVLVNIGKVSLGMPFTARRKIVHSNFGLNFVRVRRSSEGCGVAQTEVRRLAVRKARVRIPFRHPNEDPSTERQQ